MCDVTSVEQIVIYLVFALFLFSEAIRMKNVLGMNLFDFILDSMVSCLIGEKQVVNYNYTSFLRKSAFLLELGNQEVFVRYSTSKTFSEIELVFMRKLPWRRAVKVRKDCLRNHFNGPTALRIILKL